MGVYEGLPVSWVGTFLAMLVGAIVLVTAGAVFLAVVAIVGLGVAEVADGLEVRRAASRFAGSVAAGDFDQAEAVAERALVGVGGGSGERG